MTRPGASSKTNLGVLLMCVPLMAACSSLDPAQPAHAADRPAEARIPVRLGAVVYSSSVGSRQ